MVPSLAYFISPSYPLFLSLPSPSHPLFSLRFPSVQKTAHILISNLVFPNSDTKDLERVIRQSIIDGQPRTHRPWKKILIIVEGIYSMEGEICPLREIVRIKKQYKVRSSS